MPASRSISMGIKGAPTGPCLVANSSASSAPAFVLVEPATLFHVCRELQGTGKGGKSDAVSQYLHQHPGLSVRGQTQYGFLQHQHITGLT